jgi:hypothetical protein
MAFMAFSCYNSVMAISCPKCRRPLPPSGELDVDGQKLTVYQCDDCTVPWMVEGVEFPAALTFAVDADGNYLDANTLEPIILPSSEPNRN